jgi:hypothetical protein
MFTPPAGGETWNVLKNCSKPKWPKPKACKIPTAQTYQTIFRELMGTNYSPSLLDYFGELMGANKKRFKFIQKESPYFYSF